MRALFMMRGLLLLTMLLFVSSAMPQSFFPQLKESSSSPDTTGEVLRPFQLNNFNTATTETFALLNRISSKRSSKAEMMNISEKTGNVIGQTDEFFADTAGIEFSELNFRELETWNNTMRLLHNDLQDLQEQLNERIMSIQVQREALRNNRQRWELTLKQYDESSTPGTITRRVRNVLSSIDSVGLLMQNDIDFLLTQSGRLTDQEIRLAQVENTIAGFRKMSSNKMLQKDMPPVWALFSKGDTLNTNLQWHLFRANFKEDTETLFGDYSGRIIMAFIVLIALFILVFWLKGTTSVRSGETKTVLLRLYINEIFRKPVEVAIVAGLYILWLLIPDIPSSYSSIIAIISVAAILRIALEILPFGYKRLLTGFAIAYVLYCFYNLFYDQYSFSRILLLIAQVISIYYLLSFINRRRLTHSQKHDIFNYVLSVISLTYLFFLVVALIGNIFGTVSFSEYLSAGIIKSGYLVMVTYVGFHITVALLNLLITSKLFQRSNIFRDQLEYIFSKIYRVMRLLFVVAWIFLALDQFNVRDIVVTWGGDVLTHEFKIGQAPFTLVNILIFVFVIWLSLFISRIVRHILHQEVFARVEVERGMPSTIVMLVRISLITVGFLLAAAASGISLSNLTIIIGAFSVGIGFGLQNIFNNLVSGLILAFERPIKEGDIVEVNSLLGRVKKIGIRSSIIKTFEGAEVIVPNGSLISNDLINWTLSDQYRRTDIRIGVAYGTDPSTVTRLLLDVATSNPRVLNDPQPKAYFIGFGDSSLDFRLLAWIDQDHRLEVESDLRIRIESALKEVGIEIPFPQQDLHIKTFSKDAGKEMRGDSK
ncbi:MAG: mechanosensitive ion channel [Bacteroidales bacterium]|nr:mechanosensitive ion channel [Bacteroidales bacterium]